jgi:hypothetical protein
MNITTVGNHTGASKNGADRSSLTADAGRHAYADNSFRIISCPDMPFVKVECNIMCKIY